MNRPASALVLVALAAAAQALGLAAEPEAPSPLRLTLEDAIARARDASPRLAQLDALARAADAAQAGSVAEQRPNLDVSAGYTRLSHVPELIGIIPGAGVQVLFPDIVDNWSTRAEASVPLYTGGRLERLGEAAGFEAAASRRDRAAGGADLVLETTAAYWGLVTAREGERVLAEAIAAFEAHLVDARNRVAQGLAASNEVLAVQVEREQAELSRLRAANSARVAEADLARLLALPASVVVEPAESLERAEPGLEPSAALTERALAARPERAALVDRARAAELRAEAERAGGRPTVSVVAGFDFANPNRRILPNAESWRTSWDAGVGASWRVFDGGRTRAAVAEAQARADAAQRALEDVERRIRLDVTARRLDVEAAEQGVRVAAAALASARENRRVASERYRAGVAVSSELLDAEVALLRADLTRADAFARLHLAHANLARAVGE